MLNDLLSIFKKKISATEVADTFYQGIRRDFESGQKNKPSLIGSSLNPEIVAHEWMYLDAFQFDYVVYCAFGRTPVKKAILDQFWANRRGHVLTIDKLACGRG